jgi:hypothetical protein
MGRAELGRGCEAGLLRSGLERLGWPVRELGYTGWWAERERDRVGRGEGFRYFRKRFESKIEFKLEFEFQQTKEMHQHECHNKFLYFINFILEKF